MNPRNIKNAFAISAPMNGNLDTVVRSMGLECQKRMSSFSYFVHPKNWSYVKSFKYEIMVVVMLVCVVAKLVSKKLGVRYRRIYLPSTLTA